jgi:transposase
MPRRLLTSDQRFELEASRKVNTNKNVDRRLKALLMRAEGRSSIDIGVSCEYHPSYISELVSKYLKGGISAIVENHYPGNKRNMSYAEEAEFLSTYKARAEQGQMVTVTEIAQAYEERVGHSIGGSQIYYVLKRHGWRKIMPRSKHPNKPSDEVIEASKKLTTA